MKFSIPLEPGFVLEITETVPDGRALIFTLLVEGQEKHPPLALGLEERETLLRALRR